MLSYRGIIRVAMRAQGSRAKSFRDWAEDVLIEVMLTGSYNHPAESGEAKMEQALAEMRNEVYQKLSSLSGILINFDFDFVSRAAYYRNMGLSQAETGKLLGVSRTTIFSLEKRLAKLGLQFDGVLSGKRRKVVKQSFIESLLPSPETVLPAVRSLQ